MPPPRRRKPRSANHASLGQAVEELRREASLTQDGAPLQLTDAVELGAHPLSTLLRVARGLEVELDEIGARFERILREGSKRP